MYQVASTGIEMLKIPYQAPRANAVCERFLGSVRRECLDHVLILHEKQLYRVLRLYVEYFNQSRPHKAFTSRFRKGRSPAFHQLSLTHESSQYRSWAGYTYEYRRVA